MKHLLFSILLFTLSLSSCIQPPEEFYGRDARPNDEATPVFVSDYDDACLGAPVLGAREYSGVEGIHPVAVFKRASATASYYEDSYALPEAWQVSYENPEETELVACVTTIPGEIFESCDYDEDGGVYTLNSRAASYEISLHEAATGNLVDELILEIDGEACPMFWYFNSLEEDYYPNYEEPFADWIKPYVQI